MNQPPQDRRLKPSEVIISHTGRAPTPAVVGLQSSAVRPAATAREILGRDPNLQVFIGGTRLIERETK